jgi:lipopolysaccharide export system permease protein
LDKFFLIGQTTQEKLSDFIILYYAPNNQGGVQLSRILRAHEGRWNEKEKAWQLFNGLDYELDEEGVFRESQKFTEQWVNTSQYPAKLLRYSKMTPLNMTQQNLKEYIHLLKDGGQLQDVRFCQVRFNQKWAFPIASILFALLGAFLGMEHVRSQRNYGLTFGALIIFCYSVLVPFATNIGSLGIVPPFIAAWLPLVLTLGLACGIVVPNKRGFW